ncbi:hypothetical protein LZK73_18960 [Neorhizobium galegae]|nr:hypothetical protein LZK73_18960 [Neorhizobium galegae]
MTSSKISTTPPSVRGLTENSRWRSSLNLKSARSERAVGQFGKLAQDGLRRILRVLTEHGGEIAVLEIALLVEAEQIAGTAVDHLDLAFAVEHHQAMRNRLQGDIEAAGDDRHLPRRDDVFIKEFAHPVGHRPCGQAEGDEQQRHQRQMQILGEQAGDQDRAAAAERLEIDGDARAIVAADDRHHRAERHGDAGKADEGVFEHE